MGYSGLIYAAIVAAWAAVLVPRWVRRNEEIERARESDAARGVRVLQRRSGSSHAPHVLFTGLEDDSQSTAKPAAGRSESAVRAGGAPLDDLHRVFAEAARRRRRILLGLSSLTLAALGMAMVGHFPGWLPVVAAALVVAFLFVARRAAVEQERRRRTLARRMRAQPVRESSASQRSTTADVDDGQRRLVIPDEVLQQEPDDPDAWQPVPVPVPTYITKPVAPRVARSIDLSSAGSWTSGRLDPADSIVLPRRGPVEPLEGATVDVDDPAAEIDEAPERRRAVGD